MVAGARKLAVRTNSADRQGALTEEYGRWLSRAEDNVRRNAMPGRIRKTRDSVWPGGGFAQGGQIL